MSETATSDLKADATAFAKELETRAAAAEKEQLPKTAKAATALRANFVKAMKMDWKSETLAFYKGKLPELRKIEEGERKSVGAGLDKEIKRVTDKIDDCITDATKADLDKPTKLAKELKAEFERAIKGDKSLEIVEVYEERADDMAKELKDAIKKAASAEPEPVYTINEKKFLSNKLQSNETIKYEEWLVLAKQIGGVKAAKDLFGGQATKMSDGRFHFRLSKGSRVYLAESGKTVTVTGPDHEKEKK